ncbi:MAG: hypothetical protein EP343_11485 [Deltaproteobacteria bacterium]|nr:MAG: hypothetical protein EP343_11485 [Deltaproteobacteria bacterium]
MVDHFSETTTPTKQSPSLWAMILSKAFFYASLALGPIYAVGWLFLDSLPYDYYDPRLFFVYYACFFVLFVLVFRFVREPKADKELWWLWP